MCNMSGGGSLKMISGKVVCEVYLLDNSMKTLLIEPMTTVQVSLGCGVKARAARGGVAEAHPLSPPCPCLVHFCLSCARPSAPAYPLGRGLSFCSWRLSPA